MSGYHVTYSAGLPVMLAGVLACAAGGVVVSAAEWRRNPPLPRPGSIAGDRGSGAWLNLVGEMLASGLAGIGCAILGGAVGLNLVADPIAKAGLLVLFSMVGAFTGAAVASRAWRRLVPRR